MSRLIMAPMSHGPDPTHLLAQAAHSQQRGDLAGAARAYRDYLALRPGDPRVQTNLAWATAAMGDLEAGVGLLEEVLAKDPAWAVAWNLLGLLVQERGDPGRAIRCFEEGARRAPDFADPCFNLGKLLLDLRRHDEAFEALSAAARRAPGRPEALLGMSRARYFQGRVAEAMALAREARERFPQDARARIEPVLLMNYGAPGEEAALAEAHLELGRWLAGQAPARPRPEGHPGGSRLRVGYLATNLHLHSNFRCTGPVIAAHDRGAVEVFVYHCGEKVDAATRGLQAAVEHWRDCRGLGPDQVADLLRSDGISLAVGCEGLFHETVPQVLARKPAPVQATWSGYPHPLGLPTVDFRITDGVMDPPGAGDHAAFERPWRLPWFRTFLPPAEAPEPGPLPALGRGSITFVSFNNLAKLGADCLRLWAAILADLPGSRLRIAQADPGSGREALGARLRQAGVDPARVEFMPYLDTAGYLQAHQEADLHLDSFPYPGVTVAASALWMGLPSLCTGSAGAAGREGAAQLVAAGFPELVAADSEGLVAGYLALARDLPGLARFRAGARGRMAASRLLDPAGLARQLEAAYSGMVRTRPGTAQRVHRIEV